MGRRLLITTLVEDLLAEDVTAILEDPLLVAGGVIGLLLLIAIAFGIYRYLTRSEAEKLQNILKSFEDVSILMHPNPDPDAMGAAIGIQELCESQGTPATIYYPGQIRRQENRAFETVLDLDFEKLGAAEELTEEAIVLVDHNQPRGFQGAERITPEVVIDHHPGNGTGELYTDIRTEYGACASIVTEYFESLDADTSDQSKVAGQTDGGVETADGIPRLSADIATGLLYGIQADTDHLTKGCTVAEFNASAYLFPAINEDTLDRIANPQLTTEMLEIKARTIQDRVINGSFAISDVGEISEVDAIPQAAEELVRLEGISAVVVYGSKDDTIHLSGRSRDDRVHMGKTLEAVFESVPMASAGGHARMGGGQVPLQYLAGIGPSAVDADRARSDLRGMLFNALKGNV